MSRFLKTLTDSIVKYTLYEKNKNKYDSNQ